MCPRTYGVSRLGPGVVGVVVGLTFVVKRCHRDGMAHNDTTDSEFRQTPLGSNDGAATFGSEGANVWGGSTGGEGPIDGGRSLGPGGPDDGGQSIVPGEGAFDNEKISDQSAQDRADGHFRHTRIIAVGNQKGGCAKSSVALNVALELIGAGAEPGKNCLIIDLDANAGITRSLGIPTTWMGTFELMLGEDDEPEQLILKNDPDEDISLPHNVHLLPATRELENFDTAFRERRANKFRDPSDSLKGPLASFMGKYDYIVLDTGPNAGTPTIAAYKTAQYFLLSTTPERLSYDALVDALTDILAVRDSANPGLRLLGVVLSMVDRRTSLAEKYINRIKRDFGKVGQNGAFETTISRAIVVPKSNEAGLPVSLYDPKHKINSQFSALAREIEQRIELFENGGGQGVAEPIVEVTPHRQESAVDSSEESEALNG